MRVATITGSLSRSNGGVSEVARRLSQELAATGAQVEVLGVRDQFFDADRGAWAPLDPHALPLSGPLSFAYSRAFSSWLDEARPELCHVHGLWSYPGIAARRWSEKRHAPLVVSVHGMLDPWALAHSGWKKRIAGRLFERRNLASASCVHAITESEREAIRRYGVRSPVCVIPNGVDLPSEDPARTLAPWTHRAGGRKALLYLGRIHPKKGLRELIEGWEIARRKTPALGDDWILVIAGWDQGGFTETLRRRIQELKLEEQVMVVGPQFGGAKSATYHAADAFILPSFSEGLPLVVLEAWAHRLPVLMTPECGLPVGFARGAALQIEHNPQSIANGLAQICGLDQAERAQIGERGRTLVAAEFSWSSVASEVRAVYEWLLGGGKKPPTVF